MTAADDLARSAKELQGQRQEILDTLTGAPSNVSGAASRVTDFFHHTDNLLALGVCLVAVIGLYRLLRSEQIIPAPRKPSFDLLGSALVRRWILRAIFFIVLAAFGLALAMGRLTALFDTVRQIF